MKYILEGNDKELERVIKESRVRMNRGLISITPISECGVIENHDVNIQELTSSLKEKVDLISTLEEQCACFKARIVELESKDKLINDDKDLQKDDSTAITSSDTKGLVMEDEKGNSSSGAEVDTENANEPAFSDDPNF